MAVLLAILLLALLASAILAVYICMTMFGDAPTDSYRTATTHQIRRTGWQARREIDQVSDEYLRHLYQHLRR